MSINDGCLEQCIEHASRIARAWVGLCGANARKMLRNATLRNATNATTTYVENLSLRNVSRAIENPEICTIGSKKNTGSRLEWAVSGPGFAADALSRLARLSVPGRVS